MLYGLSTEGVEFVKKYYKRGFPVIDESLRLAVMNISSDIRLELSSRRELSDILPASEAIGRAKEIFFAPKAKRWGQEWWEEISHHVKFIGNSMSQGQHFINLMPMARGKNEQLINAIEAVSGLQAGRDFYYHYLPLPPDISDASAFDEAEYQRSDEKDEIEKKEIDYLINSMEGYLKLFEEVWIRRTRSVFISRYSKGIFPLTLSLESFDKGSSLHGIAGVLFKSADEYINKLVNNVKAKLREDSIKPTRAVIYVIWELDDYELFDESHYLRAKLVARLEEHFGEVIPLSLKRMENLILNYSLSKESIILSCTRDAADSLSGSEVGNKVIPGVI